MIKYYLCVKTKDNTIQRSAWNFSEDKKRDGFTSITELLNFTRTSNEGVIIQPHMHYVIEKVFSEYME